VHGFYGGYALVGLVLLVGVSFVTCYTGGWDHHTKLFTSYKGAQLAGFGHRAAARTPAVAPVAARRTARRAWHHEARATTSRFRCTAFGRERRDAGGVSSVRAACRCSS